MTWPDGLAVSISGKYTPVCGYIQSTVEHRIEDGDEAAWSRDCSKAIERYSQPWLSTRDEGVV